LEAKTEKEKDRRSEEARAKRRGKYTHKMNPPLSKQQDNELLNKSKKNKNVL